ncbi:MAG: type II secretion system F family protein [Roseinatronobacter sp.]|nr:MAG: type II secretion system F family protein [Roseinatronobacter sp.]
MKGLSTMFEIFNSPLGLIALTGVGGTLLLVLAVMVMMAGGRADPMKRFSEQANSKEKHSAPEAAKLRRKVGREFKSLEKYARFLEPENENELSDARQKMIRAGYLSKTAVRDFAALQFILAITGMIASLLLVFVIAPDSFDTPIMMAVALITPMIIGYFGPRRWLERRVEARKEEILSGFPDALDMMLICVEAGQSLDQSIRRVSKEIEFAYPALGEELTAVGEQVKAGRERSEVLRDMAKRCDVTDITSFVGVMVQASTYGTSITDALRVFAAEMRDKRIMRAEEKANTLPTKMTLGTMMFTVPPLLIILVGPSVIGIMSDLAAGGMATGM